MLIRFIRFLALALPFAATVFLPACCAPTAPGTLAYQRTGDEIMIAGQLFHTGAPVVLWTDPGGYDAYRVEKRFGPLDKASWDVVSKDGGGPESPARYNTRFFRFAEKQPPLLPHGPLSSEQIARVRGGGWDLPLLQQLVDQFVIHYDVCGTSRTCFRILHDARGLSVHFMLDIDGTIYQTLDVKERAWHATTSNDRSVGIEIANMGAYPPGETKALDRWYGPDESGRIRITVPPDQGDGGIRTPGFVGYPSRPEAVVGSIQGTNLRQYDLTPQQYNSLIRLSAALCTVLPNIRCDCPRDENGQPTTVRLSDEALARYTGILGHYHIQKDKTDPGPAFRWDSIIDGARKLMPAGSYASPALSPSDSPPTFDS